MPKTQERSISIISDSAHFVNHSSGNPQNIPVRATQCLHSTVFPRTCFLRTNKKTAGTDLHKCPLPPLCDLFRSYFRSRCCTCTESFRFFLLFRMRCHVRHVSRTRTQLCPVNSYLSLTVDLSYASGIQIRISKLSAHFQKVSAPSQTVRCSMCSKYKDLHRIPPGTILAFRTMNPRNQCLCSSRILFLQFAAISRPFVFRILLHMPAVFPSPGQHP